MTQFDAVLGGTSAVTGISFSNEDLNKATAFKVPKPAQHVPVYVRKFELKTDEQRGTQSWNWMLTITEGDDKGLSVFYRTAWAVKQNGQWVVTDGLRAWFGRMIKAIGLDPENAPEAWVNGQLQLTDENVLYRMLETNIVWKPKEGALPNEAGEYSPSDVYVNASGAFPYKGGLGKRFDITAASDPMAGSGTPSNTDAFPF